MRRNILLAVLATVFGVVVLVYQLQSPEPLVAEHTVDEYRADARLRQAMFGRCKADPGSLGETPDCINAIEAERLESRGSLRDLPPLGLDPVPGK
ncbi:MAG: EexN family lipoprotein [Gammaproteobacteria bacterium]|nr:MAG: EexN family lipoprotein [Gammaproteobacteria bacterium]